MRESTTYQAILKEGEAEGLRKGEAEGLLKGERNALIWLGTERLGAPGSDILAALEPASESQLRAWIKRVVEVKSWSELLAN